MTTKAAKRAARRRKQRELDEDEVKPNKRRQAKAVEEDEDDELDTDPADEVDDEDEAEEKVEKKKPAPRTRGPETLQESEISRTARRAKQEPADVTKFKQSKRKNVTLIAVSMGFDGEKRIRPGAQFTMSVPVDDNGHVVLPTWAMLPQDYRPNPEVVLPPGMRPRVRGGATEGGLKPEL